MAKDTPRIRSDLGVDPRLVDQVDGGNRRLPDVDADVCQDRHQRLTEFREGFRRLPDVVDAATDDRRGTDQTLTQNDLR